MAASSPLIAAAPTGAYCSAISAPALADHGSSSASRQAHSVPNSSQKPEAVMAAPRRSSSRRPVTGSEKKGRPVRV